VIRWRSDGRHELEIGGVAEPMSRFRSVWYRRPVAPRPGGASQPGLDDWAARESEEALRGLWRGHRALWVNHPVDNQRAEFKQEQLLRAAGSGFEVPETLITNDPEAAREFAESHLDGIICKPLRFGRVIDGDEEKLFFTSQVDPAQLDDLASGQEPYLLQALIEKTCDIRVTVIAGECFAVEIDSQEDQESVVDWRRGGSELAHTPHRLPADLEDACRAFVAGYGLKFGAIDLARRPDGGYAFFELNPNGQWAWIEQLCELPLSSRLADLLLSPC
jgi:glutathione synthase/RimK-type ligase-like ATP-grasp enzyme